MLFSVAMVASLLKFLRCLEARNLYEYIPMFPTTPPPPVRLWMHNQQWGFPNVVNLESSLTATQYSPCISPRALSLERLDEAAHQRSTFEFKRLSFVFVHIRRTFTYTLGMLGSPKRSSETRTHPFQVAARTNECPIHSIPSLAIQVPKIRRMMQEIFGPAQQERTAPHRPD